MMLTPQGRERIRHELRELQERRRQAAQQLRNAKGPGEPGENQEYEDAKTEQALIESRIAVLKEALATSRIVEPGETPPDRVGLGSSVRVRQLDSGEEWELTLVGAFEADPEASRISADCPMGQALIGRRPGDVVEVHAPAGLLRCEVLDVRSAEEERARAASA